jgi:hypothetical protein
MASPLTVVKGGYFTRLTPAGIIHYVRVQDLTRHLRQGSRVQVCTRPKMIADQLL